MYKRERISGVGAAGLIFAAVCIDLVKAAFLLVPIIGIVAAFMFGLVSGLGFLLLYSFFGVEMIEKGLARIGAYFLAALIPLPIGTTVATALTVWEVRSSDKAYNKGIA